MRKSEQNAKWTNLCGRSSNSVISWFEEGAPHGSQLWIHFRVASVVSVALSIIEGQIMKHIFSSVTGLALILVCGCDNGTAGGKGAPPVKPTTTTATPGDTSTPAAAKPLIGEAKETFKITLPTLSTSVTQNETVNVTIGISRGTNFDDDVTLTFGKLPEGVTLEPAQPMIPHGNTEIKISVKAAADAAVGDFTVSVSGTPAKGGANAENELKLSIKEK